MEEKQFDVIGMTCAACQANVTKAVSKVEGVESVDVSLLSNSMKVSFDPQKTNPAQIEQAVSNIGYEAQLKGQRINESEPDSIQAEWEARTKRIQAEIKEKKDSLVYSFVLLIPLLIIAMGPHMGLLTFFMDMKWAMVSTLAQLVLTMAILFWQRQFFIHGFKALFKRAPNMDSLVAIGASASFLYGLYGAFSMAYGYGIMDHEIIHTAMHALYFESAATIVTLVSLGKYLEARSKSKTSDALGKLVDLAPKSAVIERDGVEIQVESSQIISGDIVVIRPGQRIPVDGIVLSGTGYVDQSALTGESVPVEKMQGDEVISASVNLNGTFKFTATKVGSQTTLSQIIRLVDEAGNSKAPIARLADKVSGIFVPVVICIAIATFIIWMIAGKDFAFALSNAIAVLVISCPCALGLATPVAIMVSTGKSAEYGTLVKSASALENLHSITAIVLDKTGTITSGKPSVCSITLYDPKLSADSFLQDAAALELGSEHPLGKAIVEYARSKNLVLKTAENFEAIGGRGLQAELDGQVWLAGNRKLMEEKHVILSKTQLDQLNLLADQGQTPLLFACEGVLSGMIGVADTIRSTSRQAIALFKKKDIHVVMLTGDNERTAKAIASDLAVDEVIADVLPTQKESVIRSLQEKGYKVAMVGDGINDAPALARADIGIAIGAGTDIAIESADVVLMKDNLLDVNTVIDLSKATIRNIRENLFWAFFYNILGIPIAAGLFYPLFGWSLSPMFGSAAMSLSSVCVVTNALRLRFFKPKDETKAEQDSQLETKQEIEIFEKQEEYKEAAWIHPEEHVYTFLAEGMSCQHCVKRIKEALEALPGVQSVTVDLESKKVTVFSSNPGENDLFAAVQNAGYEPKPLSDKLAEKHVEFLVEGMSCAHCVKRVQDALQAVPGVISASVNLESKKADVLCDPDTELSFLKEAVQNAGYEPLEIPEATADNTSTENEVQTMKKDIQVQGMNCQHCAARVEQFLGKVDGVSLVNVDLPAGVAHIESSKPVDDAQLIQAVKDAGYEPGEVTTLS